MIVAQPHLSRKEQADFDASMMAPLVRVEVFEASCTSPSGKVALGMRH